MRIKEITYQHRNDFSAILICNHCGRETKITDGYHDNFYHTKVIPAMFCKECHKNEAGELESAETLDACRAQSITPQSV